jgi:mono/diheme cytochrome c family protein
MRANPSNQARRAFLVLLLATASSAPATHAGQPESSVAPAAEGAALFADHCAVCHGRFGEGDGIVTPSLAVVLQDLRYLTARNDGEFPREFIIEIVDGRAVRAAHGPEGMPVWGAEFARDQPLDPQTEERVDAKIDALADFLESIQITTPQGH